MNTMKHVLYIITLFTITSVFGQMGVNTTNPNSSSVLALKSIRRGFLMPRMTTSQRRAISNPANGLFVFDTDDKMFYFYDSTYVTPSYGWTGLSPWIFKDDRSNKDTVTQLFMRDLYTQPSVRSIAIGTTTPNQDNAFTVANNVAIGETVTTAPTNGLLVDGEVKINSNVTVKDTVKATVFVGNGITPIGGIIMWSGTDEPLGWKLCDGNGGLPYKNGLKIPDLRGRFIVGAGTKKIITRDQSGNFVEGTATHTYNLDSTGGADDVKASINEMPSHSHTLNIKNDGNHQHDALIDAGGGGSFGTDPGGGGSMWKDDDGGSEMSTNNPLANGKLPTTFNGSHNHNGSTMSDSGNNEAHENRPPYYVLAYLIRVE